MAASIPSRDATRDKLEMGHIFLVTDDMETMTQWYRAVLDLDIVAGTDSLVFMTFDDAHHRIVIRRRQAGNLAAPEDRQVDHIAFKVADHHVLARKYRTLKDRAITPLRATNHGISTSLYYADPDGTKVELYADNFASVEALNAWFATGAFERDPIGAALDFDACCARLDSGESPDLVFAPPRR